MGPQFGEAANWEECRLKAIEWMLARGWGQLLAKKAAFEQSLIYHTLAQLDVWLELFPAFSQPNSNHFGLNENEKRVLFVGSLAHDCGKETEPWQRYIRGGGEPNGVDEATGKVSHIVPELTAAVVKELWPLLGFGAPEEAPVDEIDQLVKLHHKALRTDGALFDAMVQAATGSLTERWKVLSELVDCVDNLVSAAGPVAAKAAASRSVLASHIELSHHLCLPRGVSTGFLHHAAQLAFIEAGYRPLIHYSEGTLYWAPAERTVNPPLPELVRDKLNQELNDRLSKGSAKLVVGSPTATMMPKPELFESDHVREYLEAAKQRVGRGSFAKKPEEVRLKVASNYLALLGNEEPSREELLRQADRIGQAQPDMVVLKFFKAMLLLPAVQESDRTRARTLYDSRFSSGSFDRLMKTSTLMAARDMANCIDPVYRQPASAGSQLEDLDPDRRSAVLIDELAEIASAVFDKVQGMPSRSRALAAMADSFLADLQSPANEDRTPASLAEQDLRSWETSKARIGSIAGARDGFCPLCNRRFSDGNQAVADLIGKPEGFTNRGLVHQPFDKVAICSACRNERVLRQLLLGTTPSGLICLSPPMELGHQSGQDLVTKARELIEAVTANLYQRRLQLGNFSQLRDHMGEWPRLDASSFVRLTSFRNEAHFADARRLLLDAMQSEYDSLDDLNEGWGISFASWNSAVDGLLRGEVQDSIGLQLRDQFFRTSLPFDLVCQTPNLVIFGLFTPISTNAKESETVRGLRELCVGLILGQFLGCAVTFLTPDEPLEFLRPEGVMRTPRIPTIRNLVGGEWVPLGQASRLANLIVLASWLAFIADYPPSNGLLQVLQVRSAGEILRHLEESKSRSATLEEVRHIRKFEREAGL